MISKSTAYVASDASVHPTLADAQVRELEILLKPDVREGAPGELQHLAKVLVTRREAVVNVLTMKPTSRPSRRKANGYVSKKKHTLLQQVVKEFNKVAGEAAAATAPTRQPDLPVSQPGAE